MPLSIHLHIIARYVVGKSKTFILLIPVTITEMLIKSLIS